MTIGMGVKPLFVSYANHYSFVHRTTIGLSANDYCTEPYPNSVTPPLTKQSSVHKLSKEEVRAKIHIDHQPLRH